MVWAKKSRVKLSENVAILLQKSSFGVFLLYFSREKMTVKFYIKGALYWLHSKAFQASDQQAGCALCKLTFLFLMFKLWKHET